jgi:prefoldin subunit 5
MLHFVDSNLDRKIDKLDAKIEKLDEKLTDVYKRVCRIEGALNNKDLVCHQSL